jgi:hypothetical protein
MDILTTILQVVLGLVFLVSGLKRIVAARKAEDGFDWWRYPRWFRPVAGFAELIGGVSMLAGIFVPALASVAGLWLAILMIVSLFTHILRVRNKTLLFPAVLFVLSAAVVPLRLMALLITLLMRAVAPDPAPLDIVPASEVVSFENDAGEFFESIGFDDQGNMYLSLATTGEIRKVASDGTQTTLAMLPSGEFNLRTFEGILATLVIDPEGFLYAAVGASDPKNKGVWQVAPDGKSRLWAQLPPDAFPNGITLDKQGDLFVADSGLDLVWRIPHDTRKAERWIVHDLLGAGGNKFLPGPNGLKFWKSDLYVAVTNTRNVVRIPVGPDGSAGEPSIYVEGIPADDFAFDAEGNVYLTTHFFNTIIRVTPEGDRAIIVTADQGVVGPTAVAFGSVPGEEDKLFVITDGGFGNPLWKGIPKVVRLDIGIPGLPIP